MRTVRSRSGPHQVTWLVTERHGRSLSLIRRVAKLTRAAGDCQIAVGAQGEEATTYLPAACPICGRPDVERALDSDGKIVLKAVTDFSVRDSRRPHVQVCDWQVRPGQENKIQTLDFPQICGRTEGNRLGRFQVQSSRLPGSGRQSLTLRAGYDAAESVEFGRWFKFGFRNHKCAFNRCPISRNHPIFYFPRLLLHKSTQTLLSAVIRCRRHSSHLARIRKAGSRRQTESPRTTESWRLPSARNRRPSGLLPSGSSSAHDRGLPCRISGKHNTTFGE